MAIACPDIASTSDQRRVEILFQRHGDTVFGHCLRRLRNRHDAEDALQATYLNAFRGLRRGVTPEFELAWLLAIANRVVSNRRRADFRRSRVESPRDLAELDDVIGTSSVRPDELVHLADGLSAMPEQQRRALLLREWQGLSYREIGAELHLTQGATEQLLFRARRTLARELTAPRRAPRANLRSRIAVGSLVARLRDLWSAVSAVKATLAATAAVGAVVISAGPAIESPRAGVRATPRDAGSPTMPQPAGPQASTAILARHAHAVLPLASTAAPAVESAQSADPGFPAPPIGLPEPSDAPTAPADASPPPSPATIGPGPAEETTPTPDPSAEGPSDSIDTTGNPPESGPPPWAHAAATREIAAARPDVAAGGGQPDWVDAPANPHADGAGPPAWAHTTEPGAAVASGGGQPDWVDTPANPHAAGADPPALAHTTEPGAAVAATPTEPAEVADAAPAQSSKPDAKPEHGLPLVAIEAGHPVSADTAPDPTDGPPSENATTPDPSTVVDDVVVVAAAAVEPTVTVTVTVTPTPTPSAPAVDLPPAAAPAQAGGPPQTSPAAGKSKGKGP